MIRNDAVWLAGQPLYMREVTEAALARVVDVCSCVLSCAVEGLHPLPSSRSVDAKSAFG